MKTVNYLQLMGTKEGANLEAKHEYFEFMLQSLQKKRYQPSYCVCFTRNYQLPPKRRSDKKHTDSAA